MSAIVLLPGLDGTGSLLLDFASALGTEFDVIVTSYPPAEALDYKGLEQFARSRLPSGMPFIIVAESFSGPLAISIAASQVPGLAGLVLCCTFARCPRRVFRLLRPLVSVIRTTRLPVFAVRVLLLGRWSSASLQRALRGALAKVAPAVIRARLRGVLDTDAVPKLRQVSVPVLCVRASHDRLVPASAAKLILRSQPAARVVALQGPHCLLQVAASSVAPTVLEFARGVGLRPNVSLGPNTKAHESDT